VLFVFCALAAGCSSVSDVQYAGQPIPKGKGILLVSVQSDVPVFALKLADVAGKSSDTAVIDLPQGHSVRAVILPAGDYQWTRIDLNEANGYGLDFTGWLDLTQFKDRSYHFSVKPGVVNYPGDLVIRVTNTVSQGGLNLGELPNAAAPPRVTGDSRFYIDLIDRASITLISGLDPTQQEMGERLGIVYTGPGSDDFPAHFKSMKGPDGAPPVTTAPAPAAAPSGAVPTADFFRNAPISSALLSPDGRLVLMVIRPFAAVGNKLTLIDLDKMTMADVFVPLDQRENFAGLDWVSDDTFVFMRSEKLPGEGHLTAIRWKRDPEGRASVQQRQWEGNFWMSNPRLHGGGHLLLGEIYGTAQEPQACMLTADVDPGPDLLSFHPCDLPLESGTIDALFDRDGNMRVTEKMTPDGIVHFYEAAPGAAHGAAVWREFKQLDSTKKVFWPVGVAAEGRDLIVMSDLGRDTLGLFEYDPDSDKFVRTVFANDEADIADWHSDRTRGVLLYLTWYSGAEPHYEIMDTRARNVVPMLNRAFPGQQAIPWGLSEDGNKVLTYVFSDTHPGAYYAFDVQTGKSVPLGERKPWIKPAAMAPVSTGTFKTQDGLNVSYLLALPPVKAKRYPLVVIPHGGPIGVFDVNYFDPEMQLLANRGYAVLKVNYRGSGASGAKFEEAGQKQWGRKIEDDISDVVHHVLQIQPIDAEKVCIFGSSYGGYSAMVSAARDPALYKCAASFAGVMDIPLLYDDTDIQNDEPARKAMTDMIGDPTTDAGELRAVSPVYLADKIQCPVFIAVGQEDLRVDVEQGYRMKTVLEKLHKPVEYLAYPDEGHGFSKSQDEVDFYDRLLAFLDENIGPATAGPARSAAKQSN
jgi:dienelactone hydrolase